MTTSELVAALRAIEACQDFEPTEDRDYIMEEFHPLVQRAVNLAYDTLITPAGNRNYLNECKLGEAGFHVFALEKDRFGWLAGGITTLKGIIAYG